MDQSTMNLLRAAEAAVSHLVEHCCKGGALYQCNPKAVAQVSRTGKWHVSAIAALCREMNTSQAAK